MEIAGEHMGGAMFAGKAGSRIYLLSWGFFPPHRTQIVGLYDMLVCRSKRGIMRGGGWRGFEAEVSTMKVKYQRQERDISRVYNPFLEFV